MSVRVRGTDYPSVKACAKALGVSPYTVYGAMSRGNLDTLGLGLNPPIFGAPTPPRPVTLWGVKFASMGEASRALGCHSSYLGNTLKRGGRRARLNLMARVMKYSAEQERKQK